jgi:hypothetical protein
MALNYAVYVSTPKLNELGTVASLHPGGSIKFCPGTIDKYNAGTIKAMAMVLTLKNGESTTCPLSKRVSATIKKAFDNGATKRDIIAAILKLNICESIDGNNTTICAPAGQSGDEEDFAIQSTAKVASSYEDLVAY